MIIYGGSKRQVEQQLECDHEWHGPCRDLVSRFNQCLKCKCFDYDVDSEAEYYALLKEAQEHAQKA